MPTIKETLSNIETKGSGSWTGNATLKDLMQEVWSDFEVDKLLSDYTMKVPGDLLSDSGGFIKDKWGQIAEVLPSSLSVTSFGYKNDKPTDTLGISGSFKVNGVEQSFFLLRTKNIKSDAGKKKSEYAIGFSFDITTWGFSTDMPLTNAGIVISTSTFDNFTQFLPDKFISEPASKALYNINSVQANLNKGAYVLGEIALDPVFKYVENKAANLLNLLFKTDKPSGVNLNGATTLLELAYTKSPENKTNVELKLKIPTKAEITNNIKLDSVLLGVGYKAGSLDISVTAESTFTIPDSDVTNKTDLKLLLEGDVTLSKKPSIQFGGEVIGEDATEWWNFIKPLPGIWFKGFAFNIEIGVDLPTYGFGVMADIASSKPKNTDSPDNEQAFFIEFRDDGELVPLYFNYFRYKGKWNAMDLATMVGIELGALKTFADFILSDASPANVDEMWLYWDEEKVTLPGAKQSQTGISVQAKVDFALQGDAFVQLLLPISATNPESMSLDAILILEDTFKLIGCMPVTAEPIMNSSKEVTGYKGKAFPTIDTPKKFDDLLSMPRGTSTINSGNCAYATLHVGADGLHAEGKIAISLHGVVKDSEKHANDTSLNGHGSFSIDMDMTGGNPIPTIKFDFTLDELKLLHMFTDIGEALVAHYNGPFHNEVVKLVNGLLELVEDVGDHLFSPHIGFTTNFVLSSEDIEFGFRLNKIGITEDITTNDIDVGFDLIIHPDEIKNWLEHFAEKVASELWHFLKDFIWDDLLKMVGEAIEKVALAVANYFSGMATQIGQSAENAVKDVQHILGDLLTDPSQLGADFEALGKDLENMFGFGSSTYTEAYKPPFQGMYLAPGGQVALSILDSITVKNSSTFFVKHTDTDVDETILARTTSFDEKRRRVEQHRFQTILKWINSHQSVTPSDFESALAQQLYGQRCRLESSGEAIAMGSAGPITLIEGRRGTVQNTAPKFPYTAPEMNLESMDIDELDGKKMSDFAKGISGLKDKELAEKKEEQLDNVMKWLNDAMKFNAENWWFVPGLKSTGKSGTKGDGKKYVSIVFQPPIDPVEAVIPLETLKKQFWDVFWKYGVGSPEFHAASRELARQQPLELTRATYTGINNLWFGDGEYRDVSTTTVTVASGDEVDIDVPKWIRLTQRFLDGHHLNNFNTRADGFYLADTGAGVSARRLASKQDLYTYQEGGKHEELPTDDLFASATFAVEMASEKGYRLKSLKSNKYLCWNNGFTLTTNAGSHGTVFGFNAQNEIKNTQVFGNGIDAAVQIDNSAFLFKGNCYIEITSFESFEGIMAKEGVTMIKEGFGYAGKGLTLIKDAPAFLNGIDTAFVGKDGCLYFVKGSHYVQFTNKTGSTVKAIGKVTNITWMKTDASGLIDASTDVPNGYPILIRNKVCYQNGKPLTTPPLGLTFQKKGTVDAILYDPKGEHIVFSGINWYFANQTTTIKLILGTWVLNTSAEAAADFREGMNAAFYNSNNNTYYLFNSNSYLGFQASENGLPSSSFKTISGNWRLDTAKPDTDSIITEAQAYNTGQRLKFKVDAAFVDPDEHLYMLKADRYAHYSDSKGGSDATVKIGLLTEKWPFLDNGAGFDKGVDAVIAHNNSLYFFLGSSYVVYDIKKGTHTNHLATKATQTTKATNPVLEDWGNHEVISNGISAAMNDSTTMYLFGKGSFSNQYIALPYNALGKKHTAQKANKLAGHWGIVLDETDFYEGVDAIISVPAITVSNWNDCMLAIKNNSGMIVTRGLSYVRSEHGQTNEYGFNKLKGEVFLLTELPWKGVSSDSDEDISSYLRQMDAALSVPNTSHSYFFKGQNYARINFSAIGSNGAPYAVELEDTYKDLKRWIETDESSSASFPMKGVDAGTRVFTGHGLDYDLFLFCNDEYLQYVNKTTDPETAEPQKIKDGFDVPPEFTSGIDAAMSAGTNFIALLKNDHCVLAPVDGGHASTPFPIEHFFNNDPRFELEDFEQGIDTGFMTRTGHLYLFRGNTGMVVRADRYGMDDGFVGPHNLPGNFGEEMSAFKYGWDASCINKSESGDMGVTSLYVFKGSQYRTLTMSIQAPETSYFYDYPDWTNSGAGGGSMRDIWDFSELKGFEDFKKGIDAVTSWEHNTERWMCFFKDTRYAKFQLQDGASWSASGAGQIYELAGGVDFSKTFGKGIDAAITIWNSNQTFLIRGNQYTAINIKDSNKAASPARSLRNLMGLEPLPVAAFEDGIDAGYYTMKEVYLFRGNSYLRLNRDGSPEPTKLIASSWNMLKYTGSTIMKDNNDENISYRGLAEFQFGIDAVLLDPENAGLIMLSGSKVLTYPDHDNRGDKTPSSITTIAHKWPTLTSSFIDGVDAATSNPANGGTIHFYKRDYVFNYNSGSESGTEEKLDDSNANTRISAVINNPATKGIITIEGTNVSGAQNLKRVTKHGIHGTLYDYVTKLTPSADFKLGIGALFQVPLSGGRHNTYLVKGNAYVKFAQNNKTSSEHAFLDDLIDMKFIRAFRDGLDAVMIHPTDKGLYLFAGDRYAKFKDSTGTQFIETGLITDIWNFGPLTKSFAEGIDGVCPCEDTNGYSQIAFFKGVNYVMMTANYAAGENNENFDARNDTYHSSGEVADYFGTSFALTKEKGLDAVGWNLQGKKQFFLFKDAFVDIVIPGSKNGKGKEPLADLFTFS